MTFFLFFINERERTRVQERGQTVEIPALVFFFCKISLGGLLKLLSLSFSQKMVFTRLKGHPYLGAFLSALPWMPVAIFFVDHGYSYARVSGRAMQVQKIGRVIKAAS